MRQTWAIFVDAYRELNGKKLFWIVLALSAAVVAAFAAVGINDKGLTVFWWKFPSMFNAKLFPPELFFMAELPSRVDQGEVTLVVLLSLGLTFLATLYPAWRAARLDPVEGLRQ